MNKKIVIIGAGTAGLAAAQRLSKYTSDFVVLERRESFHDLKNSSPATWDFTVQSIVKKFGLEERIKEAVASGKYCFRQYPHFSETLEGIERLSKIQEGSQDIYSWVYHAIVQNEYENFALRTKNGEASFRTGLVKIDPIVLHRILATGIEDKIRFGTTYTRVDKNRKIVHTDQGEIEYSVLIDASGSAMVTSPDFKVTEKHNCYEYLIRNGVDFPGKFVKTGMFYIDVDENANHEDPTNTSCIWVYPIDKRHVIIGPDDYIGHRIRENPNVTREKIMQILNERLIKDLNNDPSIGSVFQDYEIIEKYFNTLPQAGHGLVVCADRILRIGDAALDSTSAAGEGIRRALELGYQAAEAINESDDDINLARNYERRRKIVKKDDFIYGLVRKVAFNYFDDKTWDKIIAKLTHLSDKEMNQILRNEAGLLTLLRGFPLMPIINRIIAAEIHGESKKEVYGGFSAD
jgi:flavin-dependent dehydrogenase